MLIHAGRFSQNTGAEVTGLRGKSLDRRQSKSVEGLCATDRLIIANG